MPIEPERRRGPDRRRQRARGGRRLYDIPLRDPDACTVHGSAHSQVVETIPHHGYIERRHRCRVCLTKWASYQTIMDPRKVRYKDATP